MRASILFDTTVYIPECRCLISYGSTRPILKFYSFICFERTDRFLNDFIGGFILNDFFGGVITEICAQAQDSLFKDKVIYAVNLSNKKL